METTVEDVTPMAEMVEIEPKTGENGTKVAEELKNENVQEKAVTGKVPDNDDASMDGTKKEEVPVEIEPKTGISFPVKLDDGKQLNAVGLRKKSMLGMGIKIYGFGIYAENEKLKDLLRSKIGKTPAKPTKEMYQVAIDSDVGMVVRKVIVFSGLTMSIVRKNFNEGLGAAIKKLNGGKNEALTKKIMSEASDDIKLTSGSVMEISRLPGYILQIKIMGEVVSQVESELLCRAYIYLYLGDDPFDKEAKEKFGTSLLSLLLADNF
ncbi:hypothetical protein F0562_004584 [Nyssa sinensis]|uniref:Chalcone isomerase domain-containing protein n=1 Tax=Nyssa sinensis TaxID=561372 RepID=A0A5J5BYI1_9ASTE|nr:hypothetical protein F0562_004584 [Nyssa sinensis]